tara:strand:+ start:1234 stop:1587 length:354 start_codon:yes stop_codon:yes gene_type:complete
MIRECKHCESDFDTNSFHKRRVGGKINECPDCVEDLETETAVKYLGLQAGDGKSNALSVVAFESSSDRANYSRAWKAVTGFHKGKSCHLSGSQTNIGGRPMRHVTYVGGNGNHKGKL